MFKSSRSLLVLSIERSNGSVPCASSDGVELKVLLERASLGRGVGKPLFLEVDTHVVEHRDEEHVDGEGNSRNAELGSVPPTGSREAENGGGNEMVYIGLR